jgi:hypothetical protein
MRPIALGAVKREARAALPPREPVTVCFDDVAVPKNPTFAEAPPKLALPVKLTSLLERSPCVNVIRGHSCVSDTPPKRSYVAALWLVVSHSVNSKRPKRAFRGVAAKGVGSKVTGPHELGSPTVLLA